MGIATRFHRLLVVPLLTTVVSVAALVALSGSASASGDPTAPMLTSVNYSNDGTALDFTPPTQLVGTMITSYDYEVSRDGGATVYRGPTNTSVWTGSYGNTLTGSPFVDGYGVGDCPDGTTCAYQIRAVFDDGVTQSPWSPWVTETSFGTAPTLTSVNYSNDGTALYFTPPTLSSGLTITSYDYEVSRDGGATVYRGPTNTSVWTGSYGNTLTGSPFVDGYGVGDCPDGTTCTYRIRAEVGSDSFQSPWSPWVTETSFGTAPTLTSVNYSNDGTALYFTPPTLSSGLTITSYDYEVSRDGGATVYRGPTNTSVWTGSYGNTLTGSPFVDGYGVGDCPDGTTCTYRIRAEVGSDTFQSPWSPWVTETSFGTAPTLTSVNYSNDGTALYFTPPTLSSGLTITSYDYEVSRDGGATVYRGPTNTSVWTGSYGNTLTGSPFVDGYGVGDCPDGTTCTYRIRAEVGSDSFQSPWSPWLGSELSLTLSPSPQSGPAPLATTFTLTANDPSGNALNYSVAFGDGASTSGTITSPYTPITIMHPYQKPGTYNAGASVTDSSGETGSSLATVTATGTIPLTPKAGEAQEAEVGIPATLNGTGSQPSSSITSYQWNLGDGASGSGAVVQHAYASPGTYQVSLTVATATSQATSWTSVTVVPAPSGDQGLTVNVTDGSSPLSDASVAVIAPNGTRYPATSNAEGAAVIAGLPDGTYTAYVYEPGYLPGTVSATQSSGNGSATVALQAGSISQTSATSSTLDYQQILAAGLNPADPANQNVFQFTIDLAFFAGSSSSDVQVTGLLNGDGVVNPVISGGAGGGGGGSGGGIGGVGGSQGSPCAGCVAFTTDSYEVVGEPIETSGPTPQPALMWLVIPGQAQWLKEFFDVKMIVSNLAPAPFTFDNGSITLGDLPAGLSLAPTDPGQTMTQSVADVPAGGSVSADWVLRGDTEGFYGVSGTYSGTLDPGDLAQLSFPIATPSGAIHVWGGSALHMIVDADDTVTDGDPYLLRIGLENVSDVPVYNAGIQLYATGGSGYIYQPDQQLSYGTDVIEPGDTFWTDYYRLIPEGTGLTPLNVGQSFVAQTGGNVDVATTIESHASTPPVQFKAKAKANGIHFSWAAPSVSGSTGYEIFYTPTQSTPFGTAPVATVPSTATSTVLAGGLSGYYALSTATSSGLSDYHNLAHATALSSSATIALSPTSVTGSGTVTVSGSHFAAGTVTLYLDSVSGTHLASSKAGSTGKFTKSFSTSGIAGGSHLIIAVATNGSTATAALQVNPAITLSPANGNPGSVVQVTLSGFMAGEDVTLTWGSATGNSVAAVAVDSSGTGTASFDVPEVAAAKYTLYASGTDGSSAAAKFKVK